ncbi:MAG: Hsp70 family protein [Pseudomonadota bacterium]
MTTIGIDLGTTNSVAAYHDGLRHELIEVGNGRTMLPSVVAAREEDGRFLVGAQAQKRIVRRDPRFVYSNIKRQMGQPFVDGEDYGVQIANDGAGERAFVGPNGSLFAPEELSAEILKVLKASAERRLNGKVTGAVITVPAGFENNQVKATMEAAKIAGFKRVEIMTEPEAAAIAYGFDKGKLSRLVVFDLGGGTFDVVLMNAGGGSVKTIDKDGNASLGGINFDARLINTIADRFQTSTGMDLRDKQIAMMKIAPAAEEAKIDLSSEPETEINVVNVALDTDSGQMMDVSEEISREEFEASANDLIANAIEIADRMMSRAKRSPRQVDEVVLVGGMTRMPAVRKAVEDYFGSAKIRDSISADHAVAIGAAIRAAEKDKRLTGRASSTDITAMAFGIEIEHNAFAQIIPKGAPYGHVESVMISTSTDDQSVIPIAILQGADPKASSNAVLARYDHKVTPGPAASQTVQLEMMVDENGVLMVAGEDKDSGEKFEVIGAS